ncbi:hypothetical protein Tco_0747520, partial [Tanacetum coccineum]
MRCTGHGDLSSALVLRTVLDEFSLNSGHHPSMTAGFIMVEDFGNASLSLIVMMVFSCSYQNECLKEWTILVTELDLNVLGMERVHGIHSPACANEEENVNVDMVNSDANNVTKMGPTPAGNTSGMSLYANITGVPSRKALNFHTLFTLRGNGVDVVVLVESNRAISDQFANMAYMIFSFQFSSMDGLDAMLENGPWSSYARALIEVLANVELKVNIMVAMPKLVGEDFYTCTVCVDYEWKPPSCARCKVCSHVHAECPKNIDSDVVKNMKKPGQALRGVPVGPKLKMMLIWNKWWASNLAGKMANSSGSEMSNITSFVVVDDFGNATLSLTVLMVMLLISIWNTWGKFGLVKSMLNSSTRIISFRFSSMDGLDAMLENGPWSSYAIALIEVQADVELKDNIVCPKNTDSDVVKNIKKPDQAPRGVPVGPKVGFKPVKQVSRHFSNSNNVNTSGNKKKDLEPTIEMRQYIATTDHILWDIITNGNQATTDPASLSVSAPKTSLAANARRNNEKALNILLSAIPDRHLLSFHDAVDAR